MAAATPKIGDRVRIVPDKAFHVKKSYIYGKQTFYSIVMKEIMRNNSSLVVVGLGNTSIVAEYKNLQFFIFISEVEICHEVIRRF